MFDPLIPARLVVLHALLRRRRAHRRRDRHHRRARAAHPLAAHRPSRSGSWAGPWRRVGEDETAFNGRGAGHTFNITGITETADGFDEEREWARDFWSALEPYHTGVYVNFLMDEGEERVRQAYGAEKYDRLKALKRHYDPDNFFRLNQNIPPE